MNKKHGTFYWTDLTVDHPEQILDFYKNIFGWTSFEVPMKDEDEAYVDYGMAVNEELPGGGICHNRGKNLGIPPQWIAYFYVDDVAKAMDDCVQMGGSVLKSHQKQDGTYNYALLQDPIGSVFGIGNM